MNVSPIARALLNDIIIIDDERDKERLYSCARANSCKIAYRARTFESATAGVFTAVVLARIRELKSKVFVYFHFYLQRFHDKSFNRAVFAEHDFFFSLRAHRTISVCNWPNSNIRRTATRILPRRKLDPISERTVFSWHDFWWNLLARGKARLPRGGN